MHNFTIILGQEKFRTITSTYYQKSKGAIIVFDLSREETFLEASKWYEQVHRYSEDAPIFLVGNKSVRIL